MAEQAEDQEFKLPDDIQNDPNISEEEKQLIISGQELPPDDDHDGDEDGGNTPAAEEKPVENPVEPAAEGKDGAGTDTGVESNAVSLQAEQAQATAQEQQPETPLDVLSQQFADAASKKDELEAARQELVEQYRELGNDFDDGSIGEGKYRSGLFEIQEKINGINGQLAAVTQQAIAIQQQVLDIQDRQADTFSQACNAFFARPENTAFVEGSPAWQVLDAQVRVLQTSFPNMAAAELLDKARAATATIVSLPPVGAVPVAAQQGQLPSRQRPAEIPPSIGDMTSAENNQAGGGEFDYLFKLKGTAFDEAVSRLSDDQFMRAQRHMSGGRK